jgi:hypothetical protein
MIVLSAAVCKCGRVDFAYMVSWLKRHVGISAVVVFVGASISALGGVSGMPAFVVVFGALVAAGGALWSEMERTKFERELRGKSDEIARLNREIMDSVTGGDSWCRLLLLPSESVPGSGKGEVCIKYEGQYPLYDLFVTIRDMTATNRAIQAGESDYVERYEKTINVGNLGSGKYSMQITQWDLPSTDEQDYVIDFEARNGRWRQSYKFRQVNGRWAVATRVFKTTGSGGPRVLYESVSHDFPRN